MIRSAQAIILVQQGRGSSIQHRVQRVQSYATEESIDNDADTFSVQIGDSNRDLQAALDRDAEVEVNLFINDVVTNRPIPIFTGIADTVSRGEDFVINFEGRDLPTSVAIDSDALPQRWKNLRPHDYIARRAAALGIANTQIAKKMSTVKTFFTDASETEWAVWYRLARSRDMYMWTDHSRGGTLVVDKLGYSLSPSYLFGDPPRNQSRNAWIPVEALVEISSKQGRKRRVIVYGTTAKKGKVVGRSIVQQAVDTTIRNWKKQPVEVVTSTKDKTAAALHKTAGVEIFESIVGAVEWQLTIQDQGQVILQNRMCRINLPRYGLVGNFFIVGVQRNGSDQGFTQVVRIREKGFALSKRVPDAPTLQKTQTSVSDDYKPAASIAGALAATGQVRWADSFVRATREYGGSWDFAVFLGALLSICDKETGFRNIRQIHGGAENNVEWYPKPTQVDPTPPVYGSVPENDKTITTGPEPLQNLVIRWRERFANNGSNQINPFTPAEAGVGPMQLTTSNYKDDADQLGWNGSPKVGEYDGGRWNPDSNIRIAAKVLASKAQESPPADPTNADDIWIAVQRYNGSGAAAQAYANDVRARYNTTFSTAAIAAVALPKSIPPGSTNTNVNIPGHGVIALPDATPTEARKAIAWAFSHLGDPYEWDGPQSEPAHYDCSSFVTAALAAGAPYLKNELDYPYIGHHGDNTITLFREGRFKDVAKDDLLPGDLVFFTGSDGTDSAPGHVGMYLGDNLFIQDPHTNDVVKISSLGEEYYVRTYVGARRIINWTQHPST